MVFIACCLMFIVLYVYIYTYIHIYMCVCVLSILNLCAPLRFQNQCNNSTTSAKSIKTLKKLNEHHAKCENPQNSNKETIGGADSAVVPTLVAIVLEPQGYKSQEAKKPTEAAQAAKAAKAIKAIEDQETTKEHKPQKPSSHQSP